jgi:putative transcriptional regulator
MFREMKRTHKAATAKRYMSDERFARLEQSLKEAEAFARDEPNECRVTVMAVPPVPRARSKRDIFVLRRRLRYSQTMLARALNVSVKTVQAWEQGTRAPSDASLTLLAIADRHPEALLDSF